VNSILLVYQWVLFILFLGVDLVVVIVNIEVYSLMILKILSLCHISMKAITLPLFAKITHHTVSVKSLSRSRTILSRGISMSYNGDGSIHSAFEDGYGDPESLSYINTDYRRDSRSGRGNHTICDKHGN